MESRACVGGKSHPTTADRTREIKKQQQQQKRVQIKNKQKPNTQAGEFSSPARGYKTKRREMKNKKTNENGNACKRETWHKGYFKFSNRNHTSWQHFKQVSKNLFILKNVFLNTLYARCGRDRADRYNEIVELRQTGSN